MAWEVIQLVLGASVAVSVAAGAIIAAWRMIPFGTKSNHPTARLESLEEAVEAIRLSNIELADKYEITIRRNNVRVGRLRRKVAKLKDDDYDDGDDVDPNDVVEAVPAHLAQPVPAPPLSKAELFAAWNNPQNQRVIG